MLQLAIRLFVHLLRGPKQQTSCPRLYRRLFRLRLLLALSCLGLVASLWSLLGHCVTPLLDGTRVPRSCGTHTMIPWPTPTWTIPGKSSSYRTGEWMMTPSPIPAWSLGGVLAGEPDAILTRDRLVVPALDDVVPPSEGPVRALDVAPSPGPALIP